MNSIESTRSAMLEYLTSYTLNSNSVVLRLKNAVVQNNQNNNIDITSLLYDNDSVIDENTGITLKQFTNLNSYLTVFNSLYGNNSESKFKNALNNVLKAGQNSQITNAKNFVQKMKENGLTNSSAIKMYKALNSYSLVSNMQNSNFNSFLTAKV